MPWSPDPYPKTEIERVSDFKYLDELLFVRHAKVHVNKPPKSIWQLAQKFRVSLTVHPKDENPYPLDLEAPRGMMTDLASVPQAFWWFAGPIGPHLEASIIHDYLYMAWTDHRDAALKRDRDFADEVFKKGLSKSEAPKRTVIHRAVRLAGWSVFKSKPYTFEERMNDWLPLLEDGHNRS